MPEIDTMTNEYGASDEAASEESLYEKRSKSLLKAVGDTFSKAGDVGQHSDAAWGFSLFVERLIDTAVGSLPEDQRDDARAGIVANIVGDQPESVQERANGGDMDDDAALDAMFASLFGDWDDDDYDDGEF